VWQWGHSDETDSIVACARARLATAAAAKDYEIGALEIQQSWTRATPQRGEDSGRVRGFAKAGTVDVEFAIEGMGATAGTAAHGMQMDHMQMH